MGSLVSTCHDSETGLGEKYPQAADHVAALRAEDGVRVLCGVDATRLGKVGGGGKEIGKGGFDRIGFNFPHVGGLTTDVNRQVRYNQGEAIPVEQVEFVHRTRKVMGI